MFEAFKKRAITKHIRRNIDKRDVTRRNGPLNRLAFLVDEHVLEDDEMLLEWASQLGIHPKDIKLLRFLETKDKKPTLKQNQVYHKNFDWKGRIHSKEATDFLTQPFDVLVGLYYGKNAFMDLMISRSKAHFKVGLHGGDPELFDLILAVPEGHLGQIKNELIKYLRVLNKIHA